MDLILASQSPARLKTLQNAGLSPHVQVANVDEEALLEADKDKTPAERVQHLARAKAQKIAASTNYQHPTCIVGCDSMLLIEGALVGKPHTPEEATKRWKKMRGGSGNLLTGHFLMVGTSKNWASRGATCATTVNFADLSDAEIEAYVKTGEPLEVAGAFTVDSLGGPFVTSIEGDYHSVVGISLPLLRKMYNELGGFWPDLWA